MQGAFVFIFKLLFMAFFPINLNMISLFAIFIIVPFVYFLFVICCFVFFLFGVLWIPWMHVWVMNFEKVLATISLNIAFSLLSSLCKIPLVCMLEHLIVSESTSMLFKIPYFLCFSLINFSSSSSWSISSAMMSLLRRPSKAFFISITVFFPFLPLIVYFPSLWWHYWSYPT